MFSGLEKFPVNCLFSYVLTHINLCLCALLAVKGLPEAQDSYYKIGADFPFLKISSKINVVIRKSARLRPDFLIVILL